MIIIEGLHSAKKRLQKWYKDYFTVEGTYTSLLPDKVYLKKLYRQRTGKELNLKNPQTFTEKLNWLKLYDRRPEYTMMVDKYAVRAYVADKIGEEYLVPLVGTWESVEDIPFDELPDQFVLKCNHDNGVIICRDRKNFDVEAAKRELQFHLSRDYYKKCREWPYKNVKRRIICEKFMENNNGDRLVDYKIFCFFGVPRLIMVNSNRFSETGTCTDLYDMAWLHLEMQDGHYPMAGDIFEKPTFFKDLIDISHKFSKGIPFVRVDMNYWNGKLYFGELTFYHSAAFESFQPGRWDYEVGSWLELPKKRR